MTKRSKRRLDEAAEKERGFAELAAVGRQMAHLQIEGLEQSRTQPHHEENEAGRAQHEAEGDHKKES
jgi:hypothetical protein